MNTITWPCFTGATNPPSLLLRAALLLLLSGASLTANGQYAWQTTRSFPGGPKTGIAATGDSTLITTVSAGVLCSNNQGRTWRLAVRAHHVESVYATRSGQLLAGGRGMVYRSQNEGASWDSIQVSTPYALVTFAETLQGELLVGTGTHTVSGSLGSGVFYSPDQGQTWQARNAGFSAGRFVSQLAVDRHGRLYAAVTHDDLAQQPGLYTSADAGQHWTHLPFQLPSLPRAVRIYEVMALAVSPQDSLLCSFSGAYGGSDGSFGVMGNFTKHTAAVADPTITWTVHGGTQSPNWWFREPLNTVYFAANGDWYSSRIGLSSGGTLVSHNQGRSWHLMTGGLGVGAGGIREPQQFATTPDGTIFMVQNTDDKVYWTKASIVTAGRRPQPEPFVTLFPNPATETVHFANPTKQAMRSLVLTDLGGRLAHHFNLAGHDSSLGLPLHALPAGVYVATLTLANGQVVRQRLVKQ